MSAEAIDLGQLIDLAACEESVAMPESANDSTAVVSGVPFEAVYQALFGPEPTPEDIRREYFLLECD